MDEILNNTISFDQHLLIYLNQLGSERWDAFWIFITNPLHWIPLFFFLFFLGYRVFELKKSLIIALYTALAVATSLGVMQIIKTSFQRLRPIHDPNVNTMIRKIIDTNGFSFISGHSMVSAAIATLMYLILKNHYKYMFLIFLFPLLFAYSRIYLAVHYPIDVFLGLLFGVIIAWLIFIPMKKKMNIW